MTWRSHLRGVAAGAGLLFLTGCATTSPALRRWARDPALASPVDLSSVPFIAQERYQCGPAALAMSLQWAGRPVTADELVPQVYLPKRHGSLAAEMVAASWREDRLPYVLAPHLEDVLREVAAGHPVIVLENLALDWYPVWHYAVVVGFNVQQGTVILHSGLEARHVIPLTLLDRTWTRAGRWALVVLPPGTLPATADRLKYAKAVWGLERLGHLRSAEQAYAAGLQHWPDSLSLALALGNVLYAQNRKPEAARVFSEAVRRHPDSGAALNNLAQTLSDLGHPHEALAAARRAVARGGNEVALYEQTLQEIERQVFTAAPNPVSPQRRAAPPPAHTP